MVNTRSNNASSKSSVGRRGAPGNAKTAINSQTGSAEKASITGNNNPTPKEARIELFFSSLPQLRDRVRLLQSHGYTKFNLVNKNAQDTLLEWTQAIQDECPGANVCAHYSLKYNKVARQGNDAHLSLLIEEFGTQDAKGEMDDKGVSVQEILLVSGGHSPSKPRPKWNTVEALEKLVKLKVDRHMLPDISVAYNPYIPEATQQTEETQRLLAKLQTGRVHKVYLQFGTDLVRLKEALFFLYNAAPRMPLAGSVFLPTAQLIAQQKFRPWNGVHLSADFLKGPEPARDIVVELLKLYRTYNVEVLWEAPGIRTEKDLALVQSIMDRVDGTTAQGANTAKSISQDKFHNDNQEGGATKINAVSPATKRQKTTALNHDAASSNKSSTPCILLFGAHDLRLYDNLAVQLACQRHSHVVPVFLWSPSILESGGVRAEALEVLLKDALDNLHTSLTNFGLELICRNCPTASDVKRELTSLIQETGAKTVYYNTDFTPNGRLLEKNRLSILERQFPKVKVEACQSSLLYDIDRVSLTKGFHGGHWGTLMPFYKNCQKHYGQPRRPIPNHETFALLEEVQGPSTWPKSELGSLSMAILPGNHKPWHQPLRDSFPKLSHEGAQAVLDAFFQTGKSGFRRYETERSRADKELATSRLSVHLRLGTLSPNELHWRAQDHPMDNYDKKTFSRRLIWRDLAYYQLRCFPNMSKMAIRAHYQNIEWVTGEKEHRRLEAWKRGRTGYPIVDAGMRELYQTGWMTQSVRMVVASFLVEYLRVNWVKGCEFFHYTLADADTAINAMMWQNAGKCGIDQWNFVISPETASQDPSGSYTRKWVPELSKLKNKDLLHRPWQAPPEVLNQAGVVLGETYPHRIVTQLKEERAKSIESTLEMRRQSQEFNDNRGYDTIVLPNGEKTVVFTKKEYRIDRSGQRIPQHTTSSNSSKMRATTGGRSQRGRRGRR